MAIKTKVVFAPDSPPGPRSIDHQRKLAQMIADGKTDGEWERGQEGVNWVVRRTWSDRAAAQEWIDFAPELGRQPGFISVDIVEE